MGGVDLTRVNYCVFKLVGGHAMRFDDVGSIRKLPIAHRFKPGFWNRFLGPAKERLQLHDAGLRDWDWIRAASKINGDVMCENCALCYAGLSQLIRGVKIFLIDHFVCLPCNYYL